MNFNSLSFWLLFVLLVLAGMTIRRLAGGAARSEGSRLDLILLAATGLALFASFDHTSCLILLAEGVATYFLTRATVAASSDFKAKAILTLNIVLLIGVLAFFKYAHTGLDSFLGTAQGIIQPWLPAGISFYTFTMTAFAVDSLRQRQAPPGPLITGNFFGFFPLLLSGPIERRHRLVPQLEKFSYRVDAKRLDSGLPWVVLGCFFKFVLADNLSGYVDISPTDNAYLIWMNSLLYGLKIYFDFAGYSFIALGVARFFGVEVILNFLSPFTSRSIREFWRRWHVSLLCWLRDYIYIPLGGSRRGWLFGNVVVVWIVSGAWHGGNVNYLLWGLLQAAYIEIYRLFAPRLKLSGIVAWFITFLAFNYSWVFFYETNPAMLFAKAGRLLTPAAYSLGNLVALVRHYPLGDILPLTGTLALAFIILGCELARKNEENPYSILLDFRVTVVMAVCLPLLSAGKTSSFVYFAF